MQPTNQNQNPSKQQETTTNAPAKKDEQNKTNPAAGDSPSTDKSSDKR